jgi:hypothetical protein
MASTLRATRIQPAIDAQPATSRPPSQQEQQEQQERELGKRYIAAFFLAGICLCFITGLGNYLLDPLNFQRAAQVRTAAIFNRDQNIALYDASFEMRGLRREHLASMPRRPDVMLFAGSRFQLANAETLPYQGLTFYNAFIHNDYHEDYLAFAELLIRHDRLPGKLLVLSVRYRSFLATDDPLREQDWRAFASEYRAMSERLDTPAVGWLPSLPLKQWAGLVSLPAFGVKAQRSLGNPDPHLPGVTMASQLENYDILAADGSLTFSPPHLATWTPSFARADALAQAERYQKTELVFDPERIVAFARLLDELARRQTRVALVLTPMHPLFIRGVKNTPFGRALKELEQLMYRLAPAHRATVLGSFDPARTGCRENMFFDYLHFTNDCMKAVFSDLPALRL